MPRRPASTRSQAPRRSTSTPSTSRPRRCSRPCCAACRTSSWSRSTTSRRSARNGFAAKPMGTGPFIFQEWVPGDHYTLTANKNYWGGAPKIDKLVIRTIPDGSTRVASLVAGESQIIEEVPIDLIDQVERSARQDRRDRHHGRAGADLRSHDQAVRQRQDPRSLRLRDRQAAHPEADPEGPRRVAAGPGADQGRAGLNPDLKARPFDPAKAKQMLKDAGFDFNTPVPITTQNGKYVSDTDICKASPAC